MEAIWTLVQSVILPILTYGAEGWKINKTEMENIEKIFIRSIKTILALPTSTPNTILLAETGFMPVQLTINKKRIMQAQRILKNQKNPLIKRTITAEGSTWMKETGNILKEYNIEEKELEAGKQELKNKIIEQNRIKFTEMIDIEANVKSKINHWKQTKENFEPGKRPRYMNNLTRKQCRAIIKARSRMMPIKGNQGDQHNDKLCRFCNKEEETQQHIINRCEIIKQNIPRNIEYKDIFKDANLEQLKIIGDTLIEIETFLENKAQSSPIG